MTENAGFDQRGGDLATGTAVRVHRAGFRVVMTDTPGHGGAADRGLCQCMYDGYGQVRHRRPPGGDGGGGRGLPDGGRGPVLADRRRAFGANCPSMPWWTPSWPTEPGYGPHRRPHRPGPGPGFTAGGGLPWGGGDQAGATTWGDSSWPGAPSPTPACPATLAAIPPSGS